MIKSRWTIERDDIDVHMASYNDDMDFIEHTLDYFKRMDGYLYQQFCKATVRKYPWGKPDKAEKVRFD